MRISSENYERIVLNSLVNTIINLWTHNNVSQAKKAIVAVWIINLFSTLKISRIIASISLKLTSSHFSGLMLAWLVIIVKNKK